MKFKAEEKNKICRYFMVYSFYGTEQDDRSSTQNGTERNENGTIYLKALVLDGTERFKKSRNVPSTKIYLYASNFFFFSVAPLGTTGYLKKL